MKKVDERIAYKGKWLSIKETKYNIKDKKELIWESIERTNTNKTVVIMGKLVPSNRYLIIKQYRPAINNYVIGFPAGLVEEGRIEEAALRELREETGYVGEIKDISPELNSNAALLTDTVRVVTVEIDETRKENINPKQQLEDEEEIEVILVHKDKIKAFLINEKEKGVAIGMGPWYAFSGMFNF